MASYVSVVWTTGDVLTEVKLDNMVANDQSEDAHAANGMIMNNNVVYKGKDAGGTARDLLKLDTSDNLILGGTGVDNIAGWDGWTDWTPSWTNLTVGDGTVVAKYLQIGKMVFFRLTFTWGSGASISGSVTVTLPVSGNTELSGHPIANIHLRDVATVTETGSAEMSGDGLQMTLYTHDAAGSFASTFPLASTSPFTWTGSDQIRIVGFYEAA